MVGFYGGDDKTDHFIKWVAADSLEIVMGLAKVHKWNVHNTCTVAPLSEIAFNMAAIDAIMIPLSA